MGKVLSVATKLVRDFNVENRAHKVIAREKPIPAPKYKADILELERIKKEHPEIIEKTTKKDDDLNSRLKKVFVASYDPPEFQKPPPNPERPLPMSRQSTFYEYGFQEPEKVPTGKVTLKNALKFITDHQKNPGKFSTSKIAQDYNLSEEIVKNVVKYYKIFELYLPEQGKPKTTFYGPHVPRTRIVTRSTKALLDKDKKDET